MIKDAHLCRHTDLHFTSGKILFTFVNMLEELAELLVKSNHQKHQDSKPSE